MTGQESSIAVMLAGGLMLAAGLAKRRLELRPRSDVAGWVRARRAGARRRLALVLSGALDLIGKGGAR
jgi:hypothetical protein